MRRVAVRETVLLTLLRLLKALLATKQTIAGWVMVSLLVLSALFASVISPHDPLQSNMSVAMRGPSTDHPLGTDQLGRDMASRLLYGARPALALGVLAVLIAVVAGVPLGAGAAYFGGRFDQLIMRSMDVLLSFPTFLLAIVVVATLGPGFVNTVVAIGVSKVAVLARITRGAVLKVKEELYVEAARALGASDSSILFKRILPNAATPIIVHAALLISSAILDGAGLGFLGLGAQPPAADWGEMLSEGRTFLRVHPLLVTLPGMAIALSVIAFNLASEGIQRVQSAR